MVKDGQVGADPGDANAAPGTKRSVILSPAPNAVVSGKMPIRVTVDGPGVENWVLEISRDGASGWVPINPPRSDSVTGLSWAPDTEAIGWSGPYVLRLTVRRAGGEVEQKTVPITIDNSKPAPGAAAAAAAAAAGGARPQ